MRCIADAGVPGDVVQLVYGDPDMISRHLLASPVPPGSLGYALHSRRDDLRPLVGMLHGMATQHADFTAF